MAAKKISSLAVVLGAITNPFTNAITSAGSSVTGLLGKVTSLSTGVLKFTGIGAGIGAVFGALKGAASGITLAADLEQVGVAFETMLGSAPAAKKLMDDLTTFSAATPFEFPEIAASAKKLLAFGVGADDMTNKLTMLGDISAGIGAPLEDIAAIYGKIKSRGQLTGETLNQMAERGIPIYRALAASLGVAESQIAGMVTAGTIGFNDVDKALSGLTANGGQFSGMMAKQSKTMAGLWSTLTDTVGLGAAGLVTTIVEAFNIRGALSGFTDLLASTGTSINNAVKGWAPVVVGAMQSVWSAIIGIWTNILAFVSPIVSQVVGWIRANWQDMVQVTLGYWNAAYNVISTAISAAWDLVKSIGSNLVAAWNWAMDTIGADSLKVGDTVGGAFSTIASWSKWLMQKVTFALNVIAWSIKNADAIIAHVGISIAYELVKIGNQFIYIFTDVIPGVLSWFADNWRDIFTTIFNFYKSVWTNIAVNTGNFAKALWSFLKGDGFNFEWTGLLEGFENTIKKMPEIAERVEGDMEKQLGEMQAMGGGNIGDGLLGFLNEQDDKVKQATKTVTKGIGDALAEATKPPEVKEPPKIPTAEMPTPPELDINTDKAEKKAKDLSDTVKLVIANSAEAMQLQAKAAFAMMTDDQAAAKAATPKAQPPDPRGVSAAKQNSQPQANAANSALVAELKKLITTLGGMSLVELNEAATA